MDGLIRIVVRIAGVLVMAAGGFLIGWLFRAAKEEGRA